MTDGQALVDASGRESGITSARADWQPGSMFGAKYRVEAQVAEGGMGVVLRATHVDLGSPVAIKVIRPEHAANQDVVARLMDEARIAGSLRSKHVNRVVDFGKTESGLAYLVLEFMEGRDLAQHLQERVRFATTDAVDCVMQACEALAEAHAVGIVHRDLKPENLFLSQEADDELVVKVLDFGISKGPAARSAGRSLTSAWEVVGSPHYMAPEQVRRMQVDARADIWSLGVILYELCSGRTPFEADTLAGIFERIVDETRAPAGLPSVEVPQGLQAVILKCLQRAPEARYGGVVELAQALAPFGSDALQAERVARVASVTQGRMLGQRSSGQHASGALPAGTPLGLASTRRSLVPASPESPARSKRLIATLLLCAVAALVLAFSIGQVSTRAAAPPPERERPAAALVEPAAAAEPARALSALTPSAASPVSPPPATEARGAASRPRAPVVVAPVQASRVVQVPPPLASSPLGAGAAPSAAAVAPGLPHDPWNHKSFGGRR